jgi:hypothetical protein
MVVLQWTAATEMKPKMSDHEPRSWAPRCDGRRLLQNLPSVDSAFDAIGDERHGSLEDGDETLAASPRAEDGQVNVGCLKKEVPVRKLKILEAGWSLERGESERTAEKRSSQYQERRSRQCDPLASLYFLLGSSIHLTEAIQHAELFFWLR